MSRSWPENTPAQCIGHCGEPLTWNCWDSLRNVSVEAKFCQASADPNPPMDHCPDCNMWQTEADPAARCIPKGVVCGANQGNQEGRAFCQVPGTCPGAPPVAGKFPCNVTCVEFPETYGACQNPPEFKDSMYCEIGAAKQDVNYGACPVTDYQNDDRRCRLAETPLPTQRPCQLPACRTSEYALISTGQCKDTNNQEIGCGDGRQSVVYQCTDPGWCSARNPTVYPDSRDCQVLSGCQWIPTPWEQAAAPRLQTRRR